MEKNDLINNSVYLYPKSLNHKVIWKKNDNIKTCHLGSNCTELEFNITLNKFTKHQIFNNSNDTNNNNCDYLNKENFSCTDNNINTKIITNIMNYDIIVFFLLVIIFIILNFKLRK